MNQRNKNKRNLTAMKKKDNLSLIFLSLVMAMVFLSGCGSSKTENVNMDSTSAETVQSEENKTEQETTTMATTEETTEETVPETTFSFNPAVTAEPVEKRQLTDGSGYMILYCGFDSNGERVWEYVTGINHYTELEPTELVGINDGIVYITDDAVLKAFDLATGEPLWENDITAASVTSYFDEEGNLYICGFYGNNYKKISKDGNTVYASEPFGDFFWPYEMVNTDEGLLVRFDGEDGGFIIYDTENGKINLTSAGSDPKDTYSFVGATDINGNITDLYNECEYKDFVFEDGSIAFTQVDPSGPPLRIKFKKCNGYIKKSVTSFLQMEAYEYEGTYEDGSTAYLDFFQGSGFFRITEGETGRHFYFATPEGMYIKGILGFSD